MTRIIVSAIFFLLAVPTESQAGFQFSGTDGVTQARTGSFDGLILVAKKKKSKGRKKNLVGRKTIRGKNKTKIDFDAVDISGQRKNPFMSEISQTKADTSHDFVKIRYDWRSEMIQSAWSLGGK